MMCMEILRIRLCCGLAVAVSFCRFLMFSLDVSLCFFMFKLGGFDLERCRSASYYF